MKDLGNKVAVVTGAASGIGRALAERLVHEGVHVVLADIERDALTRAEADVRSNGAKVVAVPTDVASFNDVERLGARTKEIFGRIDLLCNCAGVAITGAVWEHPLADWEWVLGVNVWGVIHTLHVFVPIMLAQGTGGHVVNTGSVSGLTSNAGSVYTVSKHAVAAITESLYHQLILRGAPIGVSLVCPGPVATRIVDSDRNRPAELHSDYTDAARNPDYQKIKREARPKLAAGMSPREVADAIVRAVKNEAFYVLTHPEFKEDIRRRMDDIIHERNPTTPGAKAALKNNLVDF